MLTKYFSDQREISSIRYLPRCEAERLFPGVQCVRVDSFSVFAGWTPGRMQAADLLPVTRVIEYSSHPSLHRCDSRCQHARGRKCECSCGGKNHGNGS